MTLDAGLSPSRATALGLVLLAPAVLFVLANLLNELGIGFAYALVDFVIESSGGARFFNAVSPVFLLGTLVIALVLNALAIATLELRWENGRLVSTVTIDPRVANVGLITVGGLALAILVGYAFAENYAFVATHSG